MDNSYAPFEELQKQQFAKTPRQANTVLPILHLKQQYMNPGDPLRMKGPKSEGAWPFEDDMLRRTFDYSLMTVGLFCAAVGAYYWLVF